MSLHCRFQNELKIQEVAFHFHWINQILCNTRNLLKSWIYGMSANNVRLWFRREGTANIYQSTLLGYKITMLPFHTKNQVMKIRSEVISANISLAWIQSYLFGFENETFGAGAYQQTTQLLCNIFFGLQSRLPFLHRFLGAGAYLYTT